MTTPTLSTARLVLRQRVPDDAASLFAALSDPQAMRFWSYPPATSVAGVHDHFARADDASEWRAWAIALADDHRAIGFVSVGEKRQGRVHEIGYLLDPKHGGGGIATEAVAAVIDQLFAEGARRIFADIDPDNFPSIALVERLGFVREGRLRAEWETHIGVRDSLIFGLLADEWISARPAPSRGSSAPGI